MNGLLSAIKDTFMNYGKVLSVDCPLERWCLQHTHTAISKRFYEVLIGFSTILFHLQHNLMHFYTSYCAFAKIHLL